MIDYIELQFSPNFTDGFGVWSFLLRVESADEPIDHEAIREKLRTSVQRKRHSPEHLRTAIETAMFQLGYDCDFIDPVTVIGITP